MSDISLTELVQYGITDWPSLTKVGREAGLPCTPGTVLMQDDVLVILEYLRGRDGKERTYSHRASS